ncbi:NAD(P)-dependent oxidoreductase [Dubosiella newyorkensis]|uniref:Glutamyl-tRNA reductase n=1 Tax=Dubosiella newyorkensis TaxID=1862672 RepID=A0A1U7NPJ4_9FIRM|nr:NAD(P)-dependent oxidoreductase [Dubosiella newyorkensis]OLU47548.1 hypothetical protein BO225_02595 [Dubosiella newyorkensis]
MEFEVFGIDADQSVRDQVHYSERECMLLAQDIGQPCLILQTCHRFEIYSKKPIDPDRIVQAYQGLPIKIYTYKDQEAYRHLLEVVNGLHSQIFGEDEILHQFKMAYERACLSYDFDAALHHIFQEALRCGKECRRDYQLSKHPLSLSYLAAQEIKKRKGDLRKRRILVLGGGKIAQQVVAHLQNTNATVHVALRRQEQISCFLREGIELAPIPFEAKEQYAQQADVVIAATSAPHIVLDTRSLSKETMLLDLSSPRNLLGAIDQEIYTLDTFAVLSKRNLSFRQENLEYIQERIEHFIQEFKAWETRQDTKETIQTLHEQIDTIANDTSLYLRRKLDLNEREQRLAAQSVQAALFRLLKTPLQNVKGDQEHYHPMLKALFDLEEKEEEYHVS